MKWKLKYILPALKHQLPIKRFIRNYFITGNGWGLFSIYSHQNKSGKEKVGYNTIESANKAASAMGKKNKVHYSVYKCIYCGKYHLGRNRSSVEQAKEESNGSSTML